MKATGIVGSNSRQHNYSQERHKRALVAVVPGIVMCLPMLETGIIRINIKNRKKQSSGGYEPVATALDATEHMQDVNPGAGSYHDFIHYNYGAVSQRYYNSPGGSEKE